MRKKTATAADIQRVKIELSEWRGLSRSIEAALSAEERFRRRLNTLSLLPDTAVRRAEQEQIRQNLSLLDTEGKIRRAAALEGRYLTALSALPVLDRTILLDSFINGKPYWKIGMEVGYSEAGVRKRMSKLLFILAAAVPPEGEEKA